MSDTHTRSRNFCFTLNNYSETEVQQLKESIEQNNYIYMCWGFEVGESNTPHLQGYLEHKNAKTLSATRRAAGLERAHLSARAAKSSKLKAVAYCAKGLYSPVFIENENEKKSKNDADIATATERNEPIPAAYIIREPTWKNMKAIMIETPDVWRKLIDSPINNRNLFYESRSKNAWEHGLKPGTRSDINSIRDIVNSGGSMRDILENANGYQAAKFGQMLMTYANPTRNWFTRVVWIYGPPGTGKTELAWAYCNQEHTVPWVSSKDLEWLDGYDRHSHVIFDDLRPKDVKFNFLLKMLDRYPLRAPIKGGFVDWCPRAIFITSPEHPEQLFEVEAGEHMGQLLRRICTILYISADGAIHAYKNEVPGSRTGEAGTDIVVPETTCPHTISMNIIREPIVRNNISLTDALKGGIPVRK